MATNNILSLSAIIHQHSITDASLSGGPPSATSPWLLASMCQGVKAAATACQIAYNSPVTHRHKVFTASVVR
jgi:hypothetical protein